MAFYTSPMSVKQVNALRVSIAAGIRDAVNEYLNDPCNVQDEWCGASGKQEWRGHEVLAECNAAMNSIREWAASYPEKSP